MDNIIRKYRYKEIDIVSLANDIDDLFEDEYMIRQSFLRYITTIQTTEDVELFFTIRIILFEKLNFFSEEVRIIKLIYETKRKISKKRPEISEIPNMSDEQLIEVMCASETDKENICLMMYDEYFVNKVEFRDKWIFPGAFHYMFFHFGEFMKDVELNFNDIIISPTYDYNIQSFIDIETKNSIRVHILNIVELLHMSETKDEIFEVLRQINILIDIFEIDSDFDYELEKRENESISMITSIFRISIILSNLLLN